MSKSFHYYAIPNSVNLLIANLNKNSIKVIQNILLSQYRYILGNEHVILRDGFNEKREAIILNYCKF